MRDLEIMIPDPAKATLDDLIRSIDAEILYQGPDGTLFLRDCWRVGRFGIIQVLTGDLGETYEELAETREDLIENTYWVLFQD